MKIKDDGLCPDCGTRSIILDVDEFGWDGTVSESCSWRPTSNTKKEAVARVVDSVSYDDQPSREEEGPVLVQDEGKIRAVSGGSRSGALAEREVEARGYARKSFRVTAKEQGLTEGLATHFGGIH